MTRIVSLDTKTTGLDPDTEDVFEVAWVYLHNGAEGVVRIEPRLEVVNAMHPKAADVNRYDERTRAPAWKWTHPAQALGEIHAALDGAHIVGAVPDFDTRHLTSLYRRFGLEPPRWKHRLRCVESLVMGRLRCEVEGLSHAAELMGVEVPDGAGHTALGDARTVAAVYRAVMQP